MEGNILDFQMKMHKLSDKTKRAQIGPKPVTFGLQIERFANKPHGKIGSLLFKFIAYK